MDVGCTLYSGLRLDYSWGVGFYIRIARYLCGIWACYLCKQCAVVKFYL